jgi:hypothetical protein
MPTSKRTTKKSETEKDAGPGPKASRPYMPGYGVPKHNKGLLPWSHVSERMNSATHYWVSTVSPDGHPHSTPVDGMWIDDEFYFGGYTTTRRHRNLLENPSVCIHLESADDVIIVHGIARELKPDQSLIARLSEESKKKYGFAPPPEAFAAGGSWIVRPTMALAWKEALKDATRWQF